MPAIRLASHYLRRKLFFSFFFFFLDMWLRAHWILRVSYGNEDNSTIQQHRTRGRHWFGYSDRWAVTKGKKLPNTDFSAGRASCVWNTNTSVSQQDFVPDSHLVSGLCNDSGVFTQRLELLLLDGSIRTLLGKQRHNSGELSDVLGF